MMAMKGRALKANKSAARKQRKGASFEATAIQRKVKRPLQNKSKPSLSGIGLP
jgi:hypothetical protein